jgi:hypothetical protein
MNPTASLASTVSTDWVKFQSETDTKDTKSSRTFKRLIPALEPAMDLWVDSPMSREIAINEPSAPFRANLTGRFWKLARREGLSDGNLALSAYRHHTVRLENPYL